jgi:hypothetical protein
MSGNASNYPTSGTDGSGKSTFLRQMKIIHDGGFSDPEMEAFKPDIYRWCGLQSWDGDIGTHFRNLIDAMAILVFQADKYAPRLLTVQFCGP